MSRIAYVNGLYRRHAAASVHIEDRGFQFADGVYEVWAVRAGRLCDRAGHMARLWRSLRELAIDPPMSEAALETVIRAVLRRNHIRDGLVYLQITRGQARRDHAFPDPAPVPSLVLTAKAMNWAQADARAAKGVAAITLPETRWARCDIKSIALLPNVLAKQAAKTAGAAEAWFVDQQGTITEGASSNAWIVDDAGVLRTRDLGANILPGITRAAVLKLCAERQIALAERAFTPEEAYRAREAFITGAGAAVTPIISLDGRKIGDGAPGPLSLHLRALYTNGAAEIDPTAGFDAIG